MNEKIREIQDYFIAKILNNEFKAVKYGMHTMVINIDDYLFEMWMANAPENCKVYGSSDSFMQLGLSEEQSIECRNVLNVSYNVWRKNVLIAEKRAELEKLTKELTEQ